MKKRQLIDHLDTSNVLGMGLAEHVSGSRRAAALSIAPDPDDCHPIQHGSGPERYC